MKIDIIEGRAYPLGLSNVDTDMIISSDWLKTISRDGLGKGAFASFRADPANVFDDPRYAGSPILIAGDNFGCGSSREHAAWALADIGIKAIVAPSFSDIFSTNAFKNGILTVRLPQEAVDRLLEAARRDALRIDLGRQSVSTADGARFDFEIDPFRRHCLMNGLDEISLTLQQADAITEHEAGAARATPWLATA